MGLRRKKEIVGTSEKLPKISRHPREMAVDVRQSKLPVHPAVIVAFVLFVGIVSFIVYRCVVSPRESINPQNNAESKQFDVAKKTSSVTNEKTRVTSAGLNFTLSDFGNADFSDQSARDAEAKAALNRQLLQSFQTASTQQAPSGLAGQNAQSLAPLAPGNTYAAGNCTWYAYNRRFKLGKPVGSMWGNGGSWHYGAQRDGVPVDHTPQVGDVIDMPHHVAVVEAVGENDTVFISEMNINWVLFSFSERWIGNASSYWFIH